MTNARSLVAGGVLQTQIETRQRDREELERAKGVGPAGAMLLPLAICLARLAAREDAEAFQ